MCRDNKNNYKKMIHILKGKEVKLLTKKELCGCARLVRRELGGRKEETLAQE